MFWEVAALLPSNKIAEYLEAVRGQIRWKKAQPILLEEIRSHMIDQKEAYQKEGLDEEKATEQAILQMGDPVLVGQQLDRAHRPKPDWILLGLAGVLLLSGIVLPYLLEFAVAERTERQLFVFVGASLAALIVPYCLDFTLIAKYPKLIFCFLCLVTMIGFICNRRVNGRIENVGYLLLLLPVSFAGFVYSMRGKGYSGVFLCTAAFTISLFLALFSFEFVALSLICVSCIVILTVAVMNAWFQSRKRGVLFIAFIPVLLVLFLLALMNMGAFGEYAQNMSAVFLPVNMEPQYEFINSAVRQLLFHSRFFGEGQPFVFAGFNSSQLAAWPEIHTDYLFTFLIYRFGWATAILTAALFTAFLLRGILLCSRQKSYLGFLVSLAIILTFAVQCVSYIMSNLGFPFFVPLFLPFLSYGGKALIVNLFLTGLLLSVFLSGEFVRDQFESSPTKQIPLV